MTPDVQQRLQAHLEARLGIRDVLEALESDFRYVVVPPVDERVRNHPAMQLAQPQTEGFYQDTHSHPLACIRTRADVAAYEPIRTPEWYDFSDLAAVAANLRTQGYVTMFGNAGIFDIVNGLGSRGRGYEQLICEIMGADPVALALIDKHLEVEYEYCRRGLDAGNGCIDILYIGEDCGTQHGPLFPPEFFREFFAPRMQRFADLAHAHGAACMLHSCGSTRDLLPIFIDDIGIDILDAVQPEPVGMEPEALKHDFGDRITFCGMLSLQQTLAHGTTDDCRREAEHRIRVSGRNGGYIFSPPNTFTRDIPLENILAVYEIATGRALA